MSVFIEDLYCCDGGNTHCDIYYRGAAKDCPLCALKDVKAQHDRLVGRITDQEGMDLAITNGFEGIANIDQLGGWRLARTIGSAIAAYLMRDEPASLEPKETP